MLQLMLLTPPSPGKTAPDWLQREDRLNQLGHSWLFLLQEPEVGGGDTPGQTGEPSQVSHRSHSSRP